MRVPTYSDLQVQQNIASAQPFTEATSSGMQVRAQETGALGDAVQRTGGAVTSITADMQDHSNNLAVRGLDTLAASKITALQFDPSAGFMNRKGGDAATALPDYTRKLGEIKSEVLAQAPNDAIRDQLQAIVGERAQSAGESMTRHASGESNRFQVQTSDDRAQVSLQAGAADFRNEDSFHANLGTALHEAAAQGAMLGMDAASTKLQAQKYMDSAFSQRYAAWRAEDPVGALQNFQRNADAISPLVRVQLYHELFEAAAPSLAQQINAAGGPATGVAAPADDGAPQPRDVRNNNPGNIVKGNTAWLGEVQGSDPKFVSFESPEAGIRAMGRTLQNYQANHGLNTVAGIVERWAPAAENDTASYAQTVAKALNVKPDDPIDLNDMHTLTTVTKAIVKVENGRQPYTDAQIALGLGSVNSDVVTSGVSSTPSGAPVVIPAMSGGTVQREASAPTGNPLVDALPADWKLRVLQVARTQAHQDMAGARDALRGKVQDASASYLTNGYAPNPPTLAEFVQAEGQVERPAHYAQFQNVAVLGQHLQQVRTLPAAALGDLAASAKPVPGPGFAAAQHNYEILTTAIDQVTAQRQKDPVAFALDAGAYGIKPLNFDMQQLSPQFAQRASVATRVASDYGTAPALLSKDEASALTDKLKSAPVEVQKSLLAAVARGVDDIGVMKATMQQIAPDQPVMALAGIYQARGNRTVEGVDTADLLLRGQAILTPNKKTDGTGHEGGSSLVKMPEARLMLSEFNSQTGSAFASRPQAADLFMQATKAVYAAKSADEGDYSGEFNSKRWKQSVSLATGGVQSLNGAQIVMPYGMPLDRFQGILKDQAPALAEGAVNVQPDELRRLPLENVGDGRYLFRRGAGYLVDKSGQPLVFSVGAR